MCFCVLWQYSVFFIYTQHSDSHVDMLPTKRRSKWQSTTTKSLRTLCAQSAISHESRKVAMTTKSVCTCVLLVMRAVMSLPVSSHSKSKAEYYPSTSQPQHIFTVGNFSPNSTPRGQHENQNQSGNQIANGD